jgi:hypothetical protein
MARNSRSRMAESTPEPVPEGQVTIDEAKALAADGHVGAALLAALNLPEDVAVNSVAVLTSNDFEIGKPADVAPPSDHDDDPLADPFDAIPFADDETVIADRTDADGTYTFVTSHGRKVALSLDGSWVVLVGPPFPIAAPEVADA